MKTIQSNTVKLHKVFLSAYAHIIRSNRKNKKQNLIVAHGHTVYVAENVSTKTFHKTCKKQKIKLAIAPNLKLPKDDGSFLNGVHVAAHNTKIAIKLKNGTLRSLSTNSSVEIPQSSNKEIFEQNGIKCQTIKISPIVKKVLPDTEKLRITIERERFFNDINRCVATILSAIINNNNSLLKNDRRVTDNIHFLDFRSHYSLIRAENVLLNNTFSTLKYFKVNHCINRIILYF